MRIAVIGAGYVGLVSSACFAEFGVEVVCADRMPERIAALTAGETPIFEPGLDDLLRRNAGAGRLSFTTDVAHSVAGAEAAFIAVGTPSRRGDGHADISHVLEAARLVAGALDGYTAIVTKSTVPVGTGRRVAGLIREARPDADFDIVANPEFLREGSAIEDFMRPDRVVVGTRAPRARELMDALYRPLTLNRTPVLHTTLETAELIKYATNAFLATKITFINEMADLCEKTGANVQDLAHAIGLDGRIGPKYLHPGPGYGGSCFPKDTAALAHTAREAGAPLGTVEAVIEANRKRKEAMADRIARLVGGLEGRTVAVLGLTFKPNTDDMREAPSLTVVPRLLAAGARVRAFDPAGMREAARLLEGATFCADAYEAVEGSDALVILAEWNEFRALALDRVRSAMRRPLVIDLRNVYSALDMGAAGFEYHGLGLGRID